MTLDLETVLRNFRARPGRASRIYRLGSSGGAMETSVNGFCEWVFGDGEVPARRYTMLSAKVRRQ